VFGCVASVEMGRYELELYMVLSHELFALTRCFVV
jgi:hypothetical protein